MKIDDERYIQVLKPTIWIGKNGNSEEITAELKNQLRSRGVVKVKWLSSVEMGEKDAEILASQVSAELIGVRGKTAVLASRTRPAENCQSSGKQQNKAESRRQEVLRRTFLRK